MTDNQCIAIMAAILLAGQIAAIVPCRDNGYESLLDTLGREPETLQDWAKDTLNTAAVLWNAASTRGK